MLGLPWLAYLTAFGLAALVGFGELISRYRDAPLDVAKRLPALFYMALNGLAGVVALFVIDTFDWTFGLGEFQALVIQVMTAAFGALAVLRSALFTIRVGDADVHAGPSALIQIALNTVDRAVDRGRAQRRSRVVQEIMVNVDFDSAKKKLPSDCFALMQNVSSEEQDGVTAEVTSLEEAVDDLGGMPRSRQLGLVLMNVVGEHVLRESVSALGRELDAPPSPDYA